ncbi:MAG: hypothetical protein RL722_1990, partial [Pseudomonadota bacterium]
MTQTTARARSTSATMGTFPLARSTLAVALMAALPALAQTATATLEPVEVVGTTPLPGTAIDRDRLPANVQTLSGARLKEQQESNLAELLRRHVASVNVVETQGNPYQLELNYRGFTASPLLGQPQGLSVYLDGVRINEPFGDIVNWNLVPRAAISGMTLMPGSNPLFGLNTLGGALVLETKSGAADPGTELELATGSFGRREFELAHGMSLGESTNLFLAVSRHEEDGWRDYSPSEISQLYAKLDGKLGKLDWKINLMGADSVLTGNGLLPESMAAFRREQIYTRPDLTEHRLGAVSSQLGWDLGNGQRLSGQAYLRRLVADTLNGDLNDDYSPPDVPETGVENRSSSRQMGYGAALQWSRQQSNVLTSAGVSYDKSRTRFRQTEAEGMLDETRAVVDAEDEELSAYIRGYSRTTSVWAEQVQSLAPGLDLSLSARYNRTKVTTVDVGRQLGLDTTLDAADTYAKLNPGIGLTW